MFGFDVIASLVKGIVTGVVGPLAHAYEKRQDVTLEGAKAGMSADATTNAAWLDYCFRMESLKLQAMQWWGPRFLYMVNGLAASTHFVAVMLDSVPFGVPYLWTHTVGSWGVPKLPAPYDTYEGWIIASLFVVSITKGPLSALQTWMQKR